MRYLWFGLAVLAGLVAAVGSVTIVESINSLVHPAPADLDLADKNQISEWVRTLPWGQLVPVLVGWLIAAYLGPLVTRLLTPGRIAVPALVTFCLFLLATLVNLSSFYHPLWMWVGALLGLPTMALLGLLHAAPYSYQVACRREINAAASKVFDTVANIENFRRAVPDIVDVEFLSEQRAGLGTRFRETRMMRGKQASTTLEVTEFQQDQVIRLVSDEGKTVWDTVFQVTPLGAGQAQLEMNMDCRPYSMLSKLLIPLVLKIVGQAVEKDMDAVKQHCEQ